jgi:hypothetical protein
VSLQKRRGKCLRKEVSSLKVSGDVHGDNESFQNFILDEVTIELNVFRTFMENWV